jgi:carbamoyl-phosphate synthase large subunit
MVYEQVSATLPAGGMVHIAENDLLAATCILNKSGENFPIVRAKEPHFVDDLLAICRKNKIDYLFPFLDYGLPELAKNKQQFLDLGTTLAMSEYDTITTCEDKLMFANYLLDKSIQAIPTYTTMDIREHFSTPYFAKPRYGNTSHGAMVVNTEEELSACLLKEDTIVQPYINDEDIGVDILINDSKIHDMFMRRKLSSRAGTTDSALSIWDDGIQRIIESVVEIFDFEGPIDMDILKKGDTYYLNEVNPRFGGAYSSAIACGKNFFKTYFLGEPEDRFNNYELGMKTVKYEKTIVAGKIGNP